MPDGKGEWNTKHFLCRYFTSLSCEKQCLSIIAIQKVLSDLRKEVNGLRNKQFSTACKFILCVKKTHLLAP